MFFENMAAMLSTSIADVECKHAQSQHWSDRPFPTIVAKHINSEFKVHRLEAQDKMRTAFAGHIAQGSKCVANGPVSVCEKPKQVRKKAAYMFFRDDWLKSRKACSEETINPCSKQFWADLKEQFALLSPEMKAYYQELSEQSGVQATQQRAADLPPSDSTVSQSIVAADRQTLPANPWLAEAERLDAQLSWHGMADCIREASNELCKSDSGKLGDDVLDSSPISEDMLQRAWRRNLNSGLTWAGLLDQFNAESQQFAEPDAETPPFPKRVQYQGCCGCFCRTRNASDHISFIQKLTDEFSDIVSSFGNIAGVSKHDVLLRCDVSYETWGLVNTVYAWMVAPTAVSGIHAAEQSFILCSSNGTLPNGAFELVLERLPGTVSRTRFASHLGTIGTLRQLSSEQFAEHLLMMQYNDIQPLFPKQVKISRLAFEDLSLSKVLATGIVPDFQPRVVKMHSYDEVEVLQDGGSDAESANDDFNLNDGADPLDDDLPDEEPPTVDLLAMVCETEAPEKKRRGLPPQQNKSTKSLKVRCLQTNPTKVHSPMYVLEDGQFPSESHRELSSVIGDNAVVAAIDPESAEAILEAVHVCADAHTGRVDTACTFDLQSDFEKPTEESVENNFSAGDCPVDIDIDIQAPPNEEPKFQPSSSSALAASSAAIASSSSRKPEPQTEADAQEADIISANGVPLKICHYRGLKFGNLICEVRQKYAGSSITTAVGKINLLMRSGSSSYKAHCSIHKHCQCWVSGIGSVKLDKLVDWLAAAPDCSQAQHEDLSRELRETFGMKVHKKP